MPLNVSIVVPAYNEADNIEAVLNSLLSQSTRLAHIVEIVVVASGCTDATVELARAVAVRSVSVRVVVEERRAGKAAALNRYLMHLRDPGCEVIVVCGADLRVTPTAVEQLVTRLVSEPDVGMVGCRPIPDNDPSTMMGRMVSLLWELHHRVALENPKMGEMVAVRASLVDRVSELSVVDEASVEDIVVSSGHRLVYEPNAVVTNHGPEVLGEYFEQRRRIARGHYWLEFAFGYRVSTLQRGVLLWKVWEVAREQDNLGRLALAAAVGTEMAARLAGFVDARVVGGKRRTWTRLSTTKKLRKGEP